jgi:hypothetical protein
MRQRKNIEWEILESFDDGGDGHCYFHYAVGEDQHGNKFQGVAVMVDDHLEDIEDIEKIEL